MIEKIVWKGAALLHLFLYNLSKKRAKIKKIIAKLYNFVALARKICYTDHKSDKLMIKQGI